MGYAEQCQAAEQSASDSAELKQIKRKSFFTKYRGTIDELYFIVTIPVVIHYFYLAYQLLFEGLAQCQK